MKHWARLRWQLRLMRAIDWLLGTHLLAEAARGWRGDLEVIQAEMATLQTRLEELDASRGAILRQLCLSYLQLRQTQLPDSWLHFDPQIPSEEPAIDILTRALVTPHWARWQITQVTAEGEDLYTYDLVPDWAALNWDARSHAASSRSNLLDWLGEQSGQE